MRVVRAPDELPGALATAASRGAQGVRRRQRVPGEAHRAAPPRGDPGAGRPTSAPSTWASASARSSGGTRSWSRRRRRSRSTPSCASGWARPRSPRPQAVGYRGAGTCEFLLARGPVVLLPRDEHPDPGRASGDRAGLRRGSGAGAAPHRRGRADAGPRRLAQPARLGHRVPHHQRGSGQRLPALHRPDRVPARARRPGRALGRRGRDRATRSRCTTTRCWPSSSSGRPTGRRPSRRMARALDELVVARGRHQPGLSPAAAGRSRVPGRRDRHPVSRPPRPTCSQPRAVRRTSSSSSPWPPPWRRTRRASARRPVVRRRRAARSDAWTRAGAARGAPVTRGSRSSASPPAAMAWAGSTTGGRCSCRAPRRATWSSSTRPPRAQAIRPRPGRRG